MDENTGDGTEDKRKDLSSLQYDLTSQKKEILEIEKELQSFKKKQEEHTPMRENVTKLENEVKHIENLIRNYGLQGSSSKTPIYGNNSQTCNINNNDSNNLGEIHLGEKEVDLLICMDSNSKHINFRKLWTLRNSKRSRCYTLNQLREYIRKSDISKLKYILINIGCNDIDKKSGEEVFLEIQENINLLRTKYPNIKIILCEVTPRKDERDQQVVECNRLIHEYASKDENMFIADHSNLRENSYAML